ncbi:MAG: transposase, partial [Patescibacteria group bacterium]|nr:transposase [Patescibacteria group bacterium]
MYKTQQQQLRGLSKDQYKLLHKLCFHSARLYNHCLYLTRKQWEDTHTFLRYETGYFTFKENDNYKILPSAPAQHTCKLVERSFKSYLGLLKLAKEEGYVNTINMPHFLPKKSCFMLVIPRNGFQVKDGKLHIGISLQLKRETGMKNLILNFPKNVDQTKPIKELRIHPRYRGRYFTLEVVYEVEEAQKTENDKVLAVDVGLNNLATCFDGSRAFIIDGRKVKSINHYYNKTRSKLQSMRDKQGNKHETRRMFLLTRKRSRRIKDYIRKAAKKIMDYALTHGIGMIVVGHNKGWKDEINLGKRNNQNFVQVPFGLLMSYLSSKCQEYGLEYKEVVESHTSKCSFLDLEPIK